MGNMRQGNVVVGLRVVLVGMVCYPGINDTKWVIDIVINVELLVSFANLCLRVLSEYICWYVSVTLVIIRCCVYASYSAHLML